MNPPVNPPFKVGVSRSAGHRQYRLVIPALWLVRVCMARLRVEVYTLPSAWPAHFRSRRELGGCFVLTGTLVCSALPSGPAHT